MSLQHILLGFLVDQPGSGYDLNKRLQAEGRHFWTTDQSQIYRALYKLQADGFVDHETIIQQDSPNKKVYRVTDSGRQQLSQWLSEDTDENPPPAIWLSKLYLGRELSEADIQTVLLNRLRHVNQYRTWLQDTHAELARGANGHQIHKVRLLTYECNMQVLDAEVRWLETQLESLGELSTYS